MDENDILEMIDQNNRRLSSGFIHLRDQRSITTLRENIQYSISLIQSMLGHEIVYDSRDVAYKHDLSNLKPFSVPKYSMN